MKTVRRITGSALLALAMGGCVASTADHSHRQAASVLQPAGKPEECIRQSGIQDTHVRDDRTIDFVMKGGRIYRNTLPFTCPNLGFDKAFAHRAPNDEYCSGDTITVIITGTPIPGATCGLGAFQPIERAQAMPGR